LRGALPAFCSASRSAHSPAALDNVSAALIQEALNRLMRERTTLVVVHRLTTIQDAARILVLDRGEIVEQGQPAEPVAAEG
jgi:subfamily B ATP-binding cassette protein MsbA